MKVKILSMPTMMPRLLMRTSIVTCFAVACLTSPATAAEFGFTPSLAISEEFTDNIYEVPSNKRTEYITHLSPAFTSLYKGPYWSWDAAYTFDYRNFARKSTSNEYVHDALLKGSISVMDNFLNLDVSDAYHRVPVNVAHDTTTQSSLFLNQTDQNIATVSPYLSWRLGGKSTLKTGYRYSDTRYWGVGDNKREHSAFTDFSHELTSKLSISAGYGFTFSETESDYFNTHNVYGGFKYLYADNATIGNNWQKFSSGENATFLSWNIGIIHDFDIAVATFQTSSQTTADPLAVSTTATSYSGKLDKVFQRGNIGISATYTEYANLKTDINYQRKMSYSGYGRYEVIPSLTPNISVIAERFYMNTGSEFPYHLYVTTGLSYAFNHDLTLSLNYTYFTKRFDLASATGSIQINKAVLELKKVF
jgi:hypothetical protein